jgi:iron-sulfur cluster repair protein YtfE (RIC family)
MKRHPSLANLSRDHHQALILAQLLKKDSPAYKGLPTGIQEKADYAFEFYKEDLVEHFEKEEVIVISNVKGVTAELDQLGEELIAEHKKLRELFKEIKTTGDLVNHLDLIGNTLEKHIRKEERVFFPMIQQYCEEKVLEKIETLLSV